MPCTVPQLLLFVASSFGFEDNDDVYRDCTSLNGYAYAYGAVNIDKNILLITWQDRE
jgi:hypothetical protein